MSIERPRAIWGYMGFETQHPSSWGHRQWIRLQAIKYTMEIWTSRPPNRDGGVRELPIARGIAQKHINRNATISANDSTDDKDR